MEVNVAEFHRYDLACALANDLLGMDKTLQVHLEFVVQLQARAIDDGEGDGNVVVCSCLMVAQRKIEGCNDGSHFRFPEPSLAAMTSPPTHPAATISAKSVVGAECGKAQ